MGSLVEELLELPTWLAVLVLLLIAGVIFLLWKGYQEDRAREEGP